MSDLSLHAVKCLLCEIQGLKSIIHKTLMRRLKFPVTIKIKENSLIASKSKCGAILNNNTRPTALSADVAREHDIIHVICSDFLNAKST